MQGDKQKVSQLLKTARGQIDAVLAMIEDDRYCLDVSQQVMAAQALLGRANKEILTAHLTHCVRNAKSGAEREEKAAELAALLNKLLP